MVWPLSSQVGASHGVNLVAPFLPWSELVCPCLVCLSVVCDDRLNIMAFLL